ncbi:MAG: phosphoribosylanthranilate isomerase [Solirubrobacterales bacterium]|nr:phosphoribosylanthranilate isomerase [Solirubrobacterales bacterium]
MKVKVCGITNRDDAEVAVELGAWAIGLIHHKGSPRHVKASVAAGIGEEFRRRCEVVGVFVNPSLDHVIASAENAGLTMIQLSGNEGASFCSEVARRTGLKVIKAFHIATPVDVKNSTAYRFTDIHLFDTAIKGRYGGTGETFDWELLSGHHSDVPFILAGGLNPDNVTEAIRIVRPDAVDVASGVEASPGIKDHNKLASFFQGARYTPVAGA